MLVHHLVGSHQELLSLSAWRTPGSAVVGWMISSLAVKGLGGVPAGACCLGAAVVDVFSTEAMMIVMKHSKIDLYLYREGQADQRIGVNSHLTSRGSKTSHL